MRDAPVARQWRRLASSVVVVVTDLARGFGAVVGDNFLNIAMNCVGAVIFHVGKVTVIWFLGPVPG